jgi:hypothetical protein
MGDVRGEPPSQWRKDPNCHRSDRGANGSDEWARVELNYPGSIKAAVERVHAAGRGDGQRVLPGQGMSISGPPERRMGRAGHQGRSQP